MITLNAFKELAGEEIVPYIDQALWDHSLDTLTPEQVYWLLAKMHFKIQIEILKLFCQKNMERAKRGKSNRIVR